MDDRGAFATSEQTAALLLQSVKDYAIFMLDPGGHIVSWNPGAEAIKGYRAEEVLGKHVSLFYSREDRAAGEPERELLMAANGSFETEGWRVRKDGSRFWANIVITPLRSGDGQLQGFAKVTRDLTERRKAEDERLRLARVEEVIRLRNEFVQEASQKLNTLLVSIRLHVESLKSTVGPLSGDTREGITAKLTMLEWGLDRMGKSIENVLAVASAATDRLASEIDGRVRR
jgi:PAS domain S-box-containing protein